MAFITPYTHSVNDILTSADWNAYVRDNMTYLKGQAGAVFLENDIGVGTATPQGNITASLYERVLKVATTNNATVAGIFGEGQRSGSDAGVAQFGGINRAATGTDKRIGFLSVTRENDDDSGRVAFQTRNAGTLAEVARIDRHGWFGLGTTAPLGALHVVGQTTAFAQKGNVAILAAAAVNNTLQTLAAAGTVTKVASFLIADNLTGSASTNGAAPGSTPSAVAIPGTSFTLAVGADTVTFAVTAGGAITAQRTAGAGSHDIIMLVAYI